MVLGASPNKKRFAHTCVKSLLRYGYTVYPIGVKKGQIGEVDIIQDKPWVKDLHTVTIYLNPDNQQEYYNYLLKLQPMRVIFNPGAENQELKEMLEYNNIEVVEACTLVMLNAGNF